jgi:putative SOS response-associated peptidase YedK
MCNLYAMTTNKEAIRELARFMNATREVDNLGASPAIFANGFAPIVRATDGGGRELSRVRWGLPSFPKQLEGKNYDSGVTNLRTLKYWKKYLEPLDRRCVVPATSFCEPDQVGGSNKNTWFAFSDERPLFFFAGAWMPQHTSVRKVKDGPTTDDLFAFLTTDANADVAPVHKKAMPVILRTAEEIERWFTIPYAEIEGGMQKPLPDGLLKIVSVGPKSDGPEGAAGVAPPATEQTSLF